MAKYTFIIVLAWASYLAINFVLTKALGYVYMEIVTANINRESVEEAMNVVIRLDSGAMYIYYTSSFLAFSLVAVMLTRNSKHLK